MKIKDIQKNKEEKKNTKNVTYYGILTTTNLFYELFILFKSLLSTPIQNEGGCAEQRTISSL